MDSVMSARANKPRFRRPHFREGQLLTALALNAQQTDSMERLRLLVRAMFGQGVVFGYALEEVSKTCLTVSCGLALDRHGRELFWPGGSVGLSDLVGQPPPKEGRYTLRVHYAEHHSGREVPSYCEKEDIDWIEQGVVFSLKTGCEEHDENDCCACPKPKSEECVELCRFVCARTGSASGPVPPAPDLEHACEKSANLCPTGKPGWRYDPGAGIALGCVEIRANSPEKSGCEPDLIFCEMPEVCATRPFAYRNPLLFELIKGCHLDLARVQSLGNWEEWFSASFMTEVPWSKFYDRVCSERGFTIEFSRPVRIDTLHQASIRLTATIQEKAADYWVTHGVPLKAIKPVDGDKESKCTGGARLVIEDEWIAAEVTGKRSTLFDGALIELTIRGALIRDCCGQVFDARPLDLAEEQCGPAMPGDDFVAVFRVAPRSQESSSQAVPEPDLASESTLTNTP